MCMCHATLRSHGPMSSPLPPQKPPMHPPRLPATPRSPSTVSIHYTSSPRIAEHGDHTPTFPRRERARSTYIYTSGRWARPSRCVSWAWKKGGGRGDGSLGMVRRVWRVLWGRGGCAKRGLCRGRGDVMRCELSHPLSAWEAGLGRYLLQCARYTQCTW